MSRLALFVLACALFASVTFTFASPVSVASELVDIKKRDTRTGRVTYYLFSSNLTIPDNHTLQKGHLVLSWFETFIIFTRKRED